jgi:RimJ/RimL family protein N-acetyltransferase
MTSTSRPRPEARRERASGEGAGVLSLDGVDLTTETLRTERLVLRPYRPEDADAVYRACSDPESRHWLTLPDPYTPDDAAEFVGTTTVAARAEQRGLMTAVEADGELVGSAGLHFPSTLLGPGIGYWTAPWARGRGYAAEAARALADWAFAHGAPRVHLFADVGNAASQAVARRAGFTDEGIVRGCLPYGNRPRGDAVLFSRLPRE